MDEILAECGTAYTRSDSEVCGEAEKKSNKKKDNDKKKKKKDTEGVTLQRALFSATIGRSLLPPKSSGAQHRSGERWSL